MEGRVLNMKPNSSTKRESSVHAAASARDRKISDLLVRSITDGPISGELENGLASLCEGPWVLIGIRLDDNDRTAEIAEVEQALESAPFEFASCTVDDLHLVFTSSSHTQAVCEECLGTLSKRTLPVFASLPITSIGDLAQSFDYVRFCAQADDDPSIHDTTSSALAYFKSKLLATVNANALMHPALETLRRYDEANRTNLLNTLRVYLDYDRNAQQCANVLYLHRNSLQYRVRRIQEIAGINLDSSEERTYLRLSFFLRS